MPREHVERQQRERLMLAMAEACAERGYAAVSVADVLARAGVSRATFYALFSSKADCFISAFEAATEFVLSPGMLQQAAGHVDPRAALSYGIREFLERFAEQPELARLFMVEVYTAGPEAIRRRAAAQRRQADIITGLLGLTTEEDRFAGRAFVSASGAMVTEVLLDQDAAAVRTLHEPLLRLADRMLFGTPAPHPAS